MPTVDEIFADTLSLKATDRLALIDKILSSLYPANKGTEAMWKNEAEDRIEAHAEGHLDSISEKEILAKYEL